jgi:hypothetical protein
MPMQAVLDPPMSALLGAGARRPPAAGDAIVVEDLRKRSRMRRPSATWQRVQMAQLRERADAFRAALATGASRPAD